MEYWEKFNLNDEPDTSIDRYQEQSSALAHELKQDAVLKDLHAKAVDWHTRKAASLKMDPEMDELVAGLKRQLG